MEAFPFGEAFLLLHEELHFTAMSEIGEVVTENNFCPCVEGSCENFEAHVYIASHFAFNRSDIKTLREKCVNILM